MVRILLVSLLAVIAEAALKTRMQKSSQDAAAAPAAAGGLGYDLDAFSEEWRGEWKHEWSGDIPKSPKWDDGTIENGHKIPGWKVTNTHANGHFSEEYLPWEDKQSDSKKSETKSWYTLAQQTNTDFKDFLSQVSHSQEQQKLAEDPAAVQTFRVSQDLRKAAIESARSW